MSALNEANIKKFVAAWYYALDIHAPAKDCEAFLVDQGLELAFPEKTMRTYGEFEEWLDVIYRTFFDELHNVVSVEIKNVTATSADLDVVVAWQASWFTPPDAKSKRTSMNAFQRWVIQTSDKNPHGLVIAKYFVDRFDYAPGFAQL
jgi:hypothetical protein